MDRVATPPAAGTDAGRLLVPMHPPVSTTPNTSESFRNVRPLQTAFTSNGLVSKRRRSTLTDTKSAVDMTPTWSGSGSSDATDLGRTASLDGLRPLQPAAPTLPSRESLLHGRPLREVVETAMADRSFTKKSQTMPDTPMKPAFSMSEAASAARTHRRGRSMGGAFPSRSPLFPTPPKTSLSGTLPVPSTEAPRPRVPSGLGMGLPRTDGRRHHRSASERIPGAGAAHYFLDEPRSTGDPNDVFENPESPLRPAPSEAEFQLPSLRREQPVRRTRGGPARSPFAAVRPQPIDELQDTPMTDLSTSASGMDSPNNCFASPLAGYAPGRRALPVPPTPWEPDTPDTLGGHKPAVLHTGSLYGSEASPLPSLDEDVPELSTPVTPTRKAPHIKWFEAAPAARPAAPLCGGTVARKPRASRPRHSEPADQPQTPPAARAGAMAQSEPAHARHRYPTRLSQFEEQYATESVLGQGEFSEVLKVREKATGRVSAVKRMKRAYLGPKDRIRRLEEVDVLCVLKQRRSSWADPFFGADTVVDLLSAWEEDGYLFLQTELCPLGSLAFVLAEYGRQVGPLDEARLWKILAELAAGVDFIHKSGILHLDLKPANVLITEIGSLKITDFGMATRWPRCTAKEILAGAQLEMRKFLPRDSESISDLSFTPPSSPLHAGSAPWGLPAPTASTPAAPFAFAAPTNGDAGAPERPRRRGMRRHRKGSQVLSLEREGDREYIAPEVIFESKYGKPADLFSLGLILLEAACSVEIPDNGEPWHKLRRDDFSDVRLDALSPAMQGLITALLSSQPYLRPTAADLMELPALVAVRQIVSRGLRADELDQLPAFSHESEHGMPYPLPASKYYAAPPADACGSERMVVRFRGAMIQEDEMAFMSEVLHAADRGEHASPDTSASLMTEDAPESVETLPTSLLPSDLCMSEPVHAPAHGMELDRMGYVGDRVV